MPYFAVALIFLIKYVSQGIGINSAQQGVVTFKVLTAFCILFMPYAVFMPFINNGVILSYVVTGTTTSIDGQN